MPKENFVVGCLGGHVFSEQKKDLISEAKMSLEYSNISLFQTPGMRHQVISDGERSRFRMGPGGIFVLPKYVGFSLLEELR